MNSDVRREVFGTNEQSSEPSVEKRSDESIESHPSEEVVKSDVTVVKEKVAALKRLSDLFSKPKGSVRVNREPKEWTLHDGSKIEAVLLAADERSAQMRVMKTRGVVQVKLSWFDETDRQHIQEWLQKEGANGVAGTPISLKTHDWPRAWKSHRAFNLNRVENSDTWHSDHFEIVNQAGVDRQSLAAIAQICESVDGAMRALPLPLPINWGRADNGKRKIVIERSDPTSASQPFAGYWDSRTGHVHVFSDHLIEADHQFVVFEFDRPEKIQKYDVIVHEVTHQSTAALVYMGVPAWLSEGIAEYMAATQHAPAVYHFSNTHVSVRYHINKDVLGDRIVKRRRLNLLHLEKLMNRGILEWNRTIERDPVAGSLQYNEALLLVNYFAHHDEPKAGHFRKYLESILSGIPEEEAQTAHLLRGRSYQEIEQEISKLWEPLGLVINFQSRGERRADDVQIDWAAEGVKRAMASERAAVSGH